MDKSKNILRKLIYGLVGVFLIISCSPKLKIIDLSSVNGSGKYKDNFYKKDINHSFDILKEGTWFWSNGVDSLYIKFNIHYKKQNFEYKNAFFDEVYAGIKFFKRDKLILDDLNGKSVLSVIPLSIYTNQYFLLGNNNVCNMMLLHSNELAITLPTEDKTFILLKEKGNYKIEVPRRFVLTRVE